MKQTTNRFILFTFMLFLGYATMAQKAITNSSPAKTNTEMKTYVIEREIPNAGDLTAEQLQAISKKSNEVLKLLGPKIQWVQSYVTGNKIYCIYKAENAELIKEHANKGGFPANSISQVSSIISPATANGVIQKL